MKARSATPDLNMIDKDTYDETDAPTLKGMGLPLDILKSVYHDAAVTLLESHDPSTATPEDIPG